MPEKPHDRPCPTIVQKLAAEFVGTFFATLVPTTVDILYYTGGHVDYVSRWLARGFVTIAIIYAFSEISGAHIDPAVSFGFFLRRVMPARLMGLYWLVQFAGAFGAAALAQLVFGPLLILGASHPGPHVTPSVAVLTEIVLTFLVMIVILGCAEEEAVVGKQAALAVGLTVSTCGFFAGPISGASMNPARSIAPLILGGSSGFAWIYAVGPLAGAALAAGIALVIFGRPSSDEKKAALGE